MGNLIGQTNANGHITTFVYDDLGRRFQRTLPEPRTGNVPNVESFLYDEEGNLTRRTDFKGQSVDFQYDALNRLLKKYPMGSPNSPLVQFEYTSTGQRKKMTDSTSRLHFKGCLWPGAC